MGKYVWLLMTVLLFTIPAFATDKKHVQQPPLKADSELLEFLGSWQGSDGAWVDPMTFARIDPSKLTQDKTRQEGKLPPPAKQPPPNQDGGEQSP